MTETREQLAAAAIEWLTDDRSPSTRDLLALEGLRVADWLDGDEEARGLVRSIVQGYGSLDDMRAFLAAHDMTEDRERWLAAPYYRERR